MEPRAEQQLIERARAGDSEAMERLLTAHQDRVYRTALSLLGGDTEAAFEIAQNVLISASRNLHQFRGNSRLSTWLYRMTINFRHNYQAAQRRQRDRFVSLDGSLAPGMPDEGQGLHERLRSTRPDPREVATVAELKEQVAEQLALLAPEFREPLHLRYVEDLGYEEIASILEIPNGTVKSRINRGRAELRKRLAHVRAEGGSTA